MASEMVTNVVNIKKAELKKRGIEDFSVWVQNPKNIYIGRNMNFYVKGTLASIWKNPFSAKKYGLEQCLVLYEENVRKTPSLWDQLESLKGKEMGCWCKPSAFVKIN
jgi:hypothetical protein